MTKQLEEIIEYFKTELSLVNEGYKRSVEDRRFSINISILMFSIFIVLASTFTQIFLSWEWILLIPEIISYIKIGIIIILLGIIYSISHYIYFDWKDYKSHMDKEISLKLILRFLLYLKIIKVKDSDLSELISRIKLDFRDKRKFNIRNKKEYNKFEKKRLNEYINVIDKINNDIIKKESN